MNYRHTYHAGNFGDVLKHATLALILDYLKRKEKPFFVLDTHAGRGLYNLQGVEARKTADADAGILKLWNENRPGKIDEILAPYFSAIAAVNQGKELRHYPGSPTIVKLLMRPRDRATFVEAHPEEFAHLAKLLKGARNIQTKEGDGWNAIKALLPPRERRGLVLIDPPYEEDGDFSRLARAMEDGLKRFATGLYLLWYPLKGMQAAERLTKKIKALDPPETLRIELHLRTPNHPKRLDGSGVILVNPPWEILDKLQTLLPYFSTIYQTGKGAGFVLESLSGKHKK